MAMNRAAMSSSRPRLPRGFVRLSRCDRACFSHLGSGATISPTNSVNMLAVIVVMVSSPAEPDSQQLTSDGAGEGNRKLSPECQAAKGLVDRLCVPPDQAPAAAQKRKCLESVEDRAWQPGLQRLRR